MSNPDAMLALCERRTALRLGRLFRFERLGRCERCPTEAVNRLIERRAMLFERLSRLEARRRALAAPLPAALAAALEALAREVGAAQQSCLARSERLAAELRRHGGEGQASGLRDGAGQLLGSG